ncbi:MAG TPA: tetratricopeptide repeat protein [Cerasibacillus sp.]|uniref:tetratricopeptide repeat protein n=1 Tax=Cerasibacillus sp. TaxID=2498711 RepID=UPI002F416494
MNHIAQRIREMRIEKGLTQAELAEGIITRSYLSQIERGAFEPSYDVIEKLAKKLECNIEDLLNQKPKNKNLLLLQIQREIKLAEKNILESNIDKAKKTIENTTFNLLEEDTTDEEKGILYWIKGKINESDGNLSAAITYYHKSADVLGECNQEKKVRTLADLGYAYSQSNQNYKALDVLSKANKLAIYEQISGQIRIFLLLNLGVVHGKLNELYSAINFLEEALDLNDSLEMYYKSGEINMALGICYMQLNKTGEAHQYYSKAIDFFVLINDLENQAGTLNNLGILLRQTRNLQESVEKLNKSIELFKELGHSSKKMNVELELAETFLQLGEFKEMEIICRNIVEQSKEKEYIAKAYELLGDMEKERKNYSLAIDCFNQSATCLNDSNSNMIRRLNFKQAEIYHVLGDYEKASFIFFSYMA